MKNKHIYSSASSAYRWLNCTKSTELVRVVPEPEQSIYAKEGTEAHKELEQIVNRYINNNDKNTLVDIRPEWRTFLDHLDGQGVFEIDTEVPIEFNGIKGSIDYAWRWKHALHIRDLKWGQGQVVEAIDNAQMALYALGYLAKFLDDDIAIDRVIVGIYQPRKDLEDGESPFSYWTMYAKDIEKWTDIFNKAMKDISSGNLKYQTGSYCSWCPAHPICPEYKHQYQKATGIHSFPMTERHLNIDILSVDQVEQIAIHGKEVIKWIEAVQKLAYNYATNGVTFNGLKLVNGYGRRQWLDREEATAEKLISIGVKEPWNKKLKGLTEIEKEIGKGKLDDLTYKTEPKPTLVPIGDNRQAITLQTAEDVFDDI